MLHHLEMFYLFLVLLDIFEIQGEELTTFGLESFWPFDDLLRTVDKIVSSFIDLFQAQVVSFAHFKDVHIDFVWSWFFMSHVYLQYISQLWLTNFGVGLRNEIVELDAVFEVHGLVAKDDGADGSQTLLGDLALVIGEVFCLGFDSVGTENDFLVSSEHLGVQKNILDDGGLSLRASHGGRAIYHGQKLKLEFLGLLL